MPAALGREPIRNTLLDDRRPVRFE